MVSIITSCLQQCENPQTMNQWHDPYQCCVYQPLYFTAVHFSNTLPWVIVQTEFGKTLLALQMHCPFSYRGICAWVEV